jgi:hypothetical protein
LSGHLFDQFLINEALDIIETAGGSFHLVNCHVGQSVDAISYSELEVSSHLFQTGMITYGPRYCDFNIHTVYRFEFFEQIAFDFDVLLPFEQYNYFMLYYN